MKRLIIILVFILAVPVSGFTQTLFIPDSISGIGRSQNCNIGIETISPNGKLEIYNSTLFDAEMSPANQDHILFSAPDPGNGNYFGSITWKSGGRRRASIVATREYDDTDYVGISFFTKGTDGPGPMYESMRITRNGKVGIGTSSPNYSLDVQVGDADGIRLSDSSKEFKVWLLNTGNNGQMRVYSDGSHESIRLNSNGYSFFKGGNVGIGNTNPLGLLHIGDNSGAGIIINNRITSVESMIPAQIAWGESSLGQAGDLILAPRTNISTTSIRFFTNNGSTIAERVRISKDGHVGIGTTSPGGYMLAVEGEIGAREVIVTLDSWSDYVFENDYNLMSIDELELFIKSYKHLPGIPTEQEVLTEGVSLGEMNSILLEKIEELTLHIIKLNERINNLEEGDIHEDY